MRRNAPVERTRSEEMVLADGGDFEGAFSPHLAAPGISNQARLGLFRASSLPNLQLLDMAGASPENVARPRASSFESLQSSHLFRLTPASSRRNLHRLTTSSLESLRSSDMFGLTPAPSREPVALRGTRSGRESLIYAVIFYILSLATLIPNLLSSPSETTVGGADEDYGNATSTAGWLNATALGRNGTMGLTSGAEAAFGPLVVVPATMAGFGLLMDAWGLARTGTLHSGRALKNFLHLPPAVTLKIMGTMLSLGLSFGLPRTFPNTATDTLRALESSSTREAVTFVLNNSMNFSAFEIARAVNRLRPSQAVKAKREYQKTNIAFHFVRSAVVSFVMMMLQWQGLMKADPFAAENVVANLLLHTLTEGMVDSTLISHGYAEMTKGKDAGQGILAGASGALGHPGWTKKPNSYRHATRNPKLQGADERVLWTLTSGASSDVMLIKSFVNIVSYAIWSATFQTGSRGGATAVSAIGSNVVSALMSAKRVIEIGGVDFGLPHVIKLYRAIKSQCADRGIYLDADLVAKAAARYRAEQAVEEAKFEEGQAEPMVVGPVDRASEEAAVVPRQFAV